MPYQPIQNKENLFNVITLINNKQRKTLNAWKKANDWIFDDNTLCPDAVLFYHFIYNIGNQEQIDLYNDLCHYPSFKSTSKRNKFFKQMSTVGYLY